MAAFWDSSAIVPLCTYQETTHAMQRLMARDPSVVVWWGTPVEIRSAFGRLVRNGKMNGTGVERSVRRLATLRRSWDEILPLERLRSLGEEFPGRYGAAAGDALQLAAALLWCKERPRGRAFVCLDHRLAAIADAVGFTVVP